MNPHRPVRILIVDDNRANRLILTHGLTAEGYEVIEAAGGAEALDALASTLQQSSTDTPDPDTIDLVLLDIMMPEVSGLDVLREVRKRKSRAALPVIMATAMDTPKDIVEALQAGANDYIPKPCQLPVVAARVETHLSLRDTHRALKDAQQSLIRAAKMESIGYLAAGVAHEIRNPLARINLSLQLLERNATIASNEKLAGVIESMSSSLKEADTVVGGLMKFSAEERLDLQAVNVNSVLAHTLTLLQGEMDASGISITTEFDPALPPALISVAEFTQAMVSIFNNALQAMKGAGELVVRTSLQDADHISPAEGSRSGNRLRSGEKAIAIEIRDTGPGLSQEELLKVFDAFYTTKPADLATGMGLTVARKIIDLHGGTLELSNRKNEAGVCVTIFLRKAGTFQTTV